MPPKPNGFMVFATEWRAKHRTSLQEAINSAGERWKTMSAQERGPYNEKAKIGKIKAKTEKLTCTGTPLSLVEKERREKDQQERDMKRFIEIVVKNSIKSGDLANKKFYFVMVNYFSKSANGGIYVPAEISVSEFSLANGVSNVYHSFINPGVVIYGHTYEAKQHSETTHNLPLPPKAFGEKNMGKIYNDVLHFIRPEDDSEYPPVYTEREHMPIVESVFKFLCSDDGANNVDLKVYSIQYLFYILKEGTCEIGELQKPDSVFITDAYFERDYFEFQTGIACEFHETADKSKYCTLSCVTRWGYIFSEYMCNDIAINLIPGRHIPATTNFEAVKQKDFGETRSYVSGTEASFASKALRGQRGYYDEQKSYVSDATVLSASDFPKLQSGGKKRSNNNSVSKFNEDDIVDECKVNPWTTRSQKVPKQPDLSCFKIDRTGISVNDDDLEADDIQSVSSYGRGRGYLRSQPYRGRFGRGQNFDEV